MPADDDIKFGTLKCRDLVQLYYGARMVTAVVENFFALTPAAQTQIMTKDPRRIRYEIVVPNAGAAPVTLVIGSNTGVSNGVAPNYNLPATVGQLNLVRNFLTDLDDVTDEVWAQPTGNVDIFVRETFLTPVPVDEKP